jgi:hypothetical protein
MRPGVCGGRVRSIRSHLPKGIVMTIKPSSVPAGIVVTTGIVGGPKKIFIGGLS